MNNITRILQAINIATQGYRILKDLFAPDFFGLRIYEDLEAFEKGVFTKLPLNITEITPKTSSDPSELPVQKGKVMTDNIIQKPDVITFTAIDNNGIRLFDEITRADTSFLKTRKLPNRTQTLLENIKEISTKKQFVQLITPSFFEPEKIYVITEINEGGREPELRYNYISLQISIQEIQLFNIVDTQEIKKVNATEYNGNGTI